MTKTRFTLIALALLLCLALVSFAQKAKPKEAPPTPKEQPPPSPAPVPIVGESVAVPLSELPEYIVLREGNRIIKIVIERDPTRLPQVIIDDDQPNERGGQYMDSAFVQISAVRVGDKVKVVFSADMPDRPYEGRGAASVRGFAIIDEPFSILSKVTGAGLYVRLDGSRQVAVNAECGCIDPKYSQTTCELGNPPGFGSPIPTHPAPCG